MTIDRAVLKSMLHEAQAYRKASHVLRLTLRKKNDFQLLGPLVVNGTFAAEIYLKTLLAVRLKAVVRSHRLDALWRSVPSADKTCLEALFKLHVERNKKARAGGPEAKADSALDTLIATAANAFVEWRYLYEPTVPSAPTTIWELVEALEEHVAPIVNRTSAA